MAGARRCGPTKLGLCALELSDADDEQRAGAAGSFDGDGLAGGGAEEGAGERGLMADGAAVGVGFVRADEAVGRLFAGEIAHGDGGAEFDDGAGSGGRWDDIGGAEALLELADAVVEGKEVAFGVGGLRRGDEGGAGGEESVGRGAEARGAFGGEERALTGSERGDGPEHGLVGGVVGFAEEGFAHAGR